MIKVFSFVASCRGKYSKTARMSNDLAKRFIEKAEAAEETVEYEMMTGDQLRVDYCRSCNNCFMKGECPLDSVDDMAKLKSKFLEADIIFFGTPVYLWEMSGMAKSVLDRISYWTHRLELAGKIGVTFDTTSSSHGPEVAENLKKLLEFTGMNVVSTAYALSDGHPTLYYKKDMDPIYDEICDRLLEAWRDPTAFITEDNENVFLNIKAQTKQRVKLAELTGREPAAETMVNYERGIMEFDNYKEMLISIKKEKE